MIGGLVVLLRFRMMARLLLVKDTIGAKTKLLSLEHKHW